MAAEFATDDFQFVVVLVLVLLLIRLLVRLLMLGLIHMLVVPPAVRLVIGLVLQCQ